MNDKNWKILVENKKPIEEVQEIEIIVKEDIYEAEKVEEDEAYFSDEFAYSHLATPRTDDARFIVRLRLKNCYLTDAGAWGTFLGFGERLDFLPLNKIEKIKELLADLETNQVRIVSESWSWDAKHISSLKRNLVKQLKEIVRGYENGGTVNVNIEIKN